ncbi:hypothetical protein [Paenibacillus sp. MSJ-34]|uniref:hypothetical protein n=1 Tax=Paenibacillus sp. MSJ-34 TaxID=2841529 RepID=UPI001C0F5EA6|nr:hypothetical protein [Paenibacillus sp. MSJ-34]MBU5442058.1 hypothetical protein [Paenibacillus sp. MSJ-34]
MNKHDKSRKDSLIKALNKAKEQAETARLYLIANERDPEEIAAACLALEHIEIALSHLGVQINGKGVLGSDSGYFG